MQKQTVVYQMAQRAGRRKSSGFTLIEVLIVFSLIAILSVSSLMGFVNSQRSFVFNGAVQQMVSVVREARSLALSGKAMLDYTDYDQDGLNDEDDDYVTPAHYGAHLDTAARTVTLFADLYGSGTQGVYDAPSDFTAIGSYEPGRDIILARYELPPNFSLILVPDTTTTILYTPVFADTLLNPPLSNGDIFLVFGIAEETGPAMNTRCFAIHPAAGVPETAQAADVLDLCTL